MDYSLAALKVVCAQLKDACDVPSQNASTLGGILFQRAWLQGILVSKSGDGRLLLDDGTGVIELHLSGDFRSREWDVGMYVMVVGGYFRRKGDTPMVKGLVILTVRKNTLHQNQDILIEFKHFMYADREAMWYLEVIEAYKLFYQHLIEGFV